jgi:hypothetical protein
VGHDTTTHECAYTIFATLVGMNPTIARCTLLIWLISAGDLACYAQAKNACELFAKADAESILGVPVEPFAPAGMSSQQCRFRQVGWQQTAPNNKEVDVYLTLATSNPYATLLGRMREFVDAAPKRSLRELTDLGDAAFWEWSADDGGIGGLSAYKGANVEAGVGVFGVPEGIAFAGAKNVAMKLLGNTDKTGYVYPNSPAQKGVAMSILPISGDAMGASVKIPAEIKSQLADLQQKGQRVLQCIYKPFTSATTYFYWYGGVPDNLDLLLIMVNSNPLGALGNTSRGPAPRLLSWRKNSLQWRVTSRNNWNKRGISR